MAGTLATMNVGAWVCFIVMQRHTENEQEGSRNANKSGIPVSTRIRGRYSGDTIVCRVQRHFVCYFLSNNTRCARVSNDMPTEVAVVVGRHEGHAPAPKGDGALLVLDDDVGVLAGLCDEVEGQQVVGDGWHMQHVAQDDGAALAIGAGDVEDGSAFANDVLREQWAILCSCDRNCPHAISLFCVWHFWHLMA